MLDERTLDHRSCCRGLGWYTNVRSNVSAEDWERLKRITFQRAGSRCEICGGRGPQWLVECHESWHYDDVHHIQKLGGLLELSPGLP